MTSRKRDEFVYHFCHQSLGIVGGFWSGGTVLAQDHETAVQALMADHPTVCNMTVRITDRCDPMASTVFVASREMPMGEVIVNKVS